ncbi:energy transducer TonB [Sphingomonas sp. UYP23]
MIVACGVLGIAVILLLSIGIATVRDSPADWDPDAPRDRAESVARGYRASSEPPYPHGAIPTGGAADWITAADYPAAALERNEQGKVGVELAIGDTGRVVACRINESSGHESLDQAACRALRGRARFAPARDANGTPIAATWHRNVVWRLPS